MSTLTRIVAWPFRQLLLTFAIRVAPKTAYRAATIVQLTPGQQVDPRLVNAISQAGQLLATYDQRWLAHFDQRVRRILIGDRGQPMWIPSLAAIYLPSEYVLTTPSEALALTLVHEIMHARLWSRGIRYPLSLRRRIEELCTRVEVEFATRLPAAAQWIEITRAKLANEWWRT